MTNQLSPMRFYAMLMVGIGMVAIGFVLFLFLNKPTASSDEFSIVPAQVDFAAPKLTLTDLSGKSVSLNDHLGSVVLVNLWATWCPPCKQEMPTLQTFYNKYVDRGFTIIAINDGDPAPDVLQFVKEYELTFPVWLDPTYNATEHAFKTLNLPSSYVIDRNGIVRLMWVGGISKKMLDQYVPSIITENQ